MTGTAETGLVGQLNIPVGEINEMFPRIVPGLAELEVQHRAPLWTLRLVQELEASLVRRAITLAARRMNISPVCGDKLFRRAKPANCARRPVTEFCSGVVSRPPLPLLRPRRETLP